MFKALALGGGGIRGGLHVGALVAYESLRGNLHFPSGIYGSSVGAIVATAVAFGLKANEIREMFHDMGSFESSIPSLRLQSFSELKSTKGLFPMNTFEDMVASIFNKKGIDLKNKVIADAKQPLYIVASNMTKYQPTIFTGNVPVLSALRCSCCLPFIFRPEVMYGQVYLDGGVFTHCIEKIVPAELRHETFMIHIAKPPSPVSPIELTNMGLMDYAGVIYASGFAGFPSNQVLWIRDRKFHTTQVITHEDREKMIEFGYVAAKKYLTERLVDKFDEVLACNTLG